MRTSIRLESAIPPTSKLIIRGEKQEKGNLKILFYGRTLEKLFDTLCHLI